MKVLLFDFVNHVTRWISQDEAREMMDEQERRGVRLSSGQMPPAAESDSGSAA